MSPGSLKLVALAAAMVLLFWAVGAYNRVVRLRHDLVRRFVPLDAHWRQRHALLLRLVETLAPRLANAQPRLELLRTACAQSEAARDHACTRPGAPGAIASLRLADQILTDARARLPMPAAAGAAPTSADPDADALPALNAQLALTDTALAFARRDFNEAVAAYNRAIVEFPTTWLAAVFGFRPAGVL